jgi:hypothetical protein
MEKSVTQILSVAEWDSDPLVPVTVTVNRPATGSGQERVTLAAEPKATEDGLTTQFADDGLTDRLTAPENPLIPLTLIVDDALEPMKTVIALGTALMLKS